MRDFVGKVAVVTGGASGIGRGLATRFAEEGMKVVLADIEQPVLESTVAELRQREFDVLGVVTDVASADSMQALAEKTLAEYGKVHVLCNNAGVGGSWVPHIWDATLKDWRWTVGVNLWGVAHGVRIFVPIMLAQDEEGHIVNTASSAGLTPGGGVYGVTKHAIVALSESLYTGLRQVDSKLHASVLCPGVINTSLMFATRNRPEELQDVPGAPPTELEIERSERMHKLAVETGMSPEEAASIVLQAIRDEQFWILTHDHADDRIRARFESLITRSNPPVAPRN